MAPTIHCVRHGQGLHNVGVGCYTIPDPSLTPLGQEQATTLLRTAFADQSKISLITASPLLRTLQTAIIAFQPALATKNKGHPRILCLPDAQETSDDPCDIGSDPGVLESIVAENGWPVDLSLVHEGWSSKTLGTRYSPESRAIAARARDVRVFLRNKIRQMVDEGNPDAQVVLVTHGGFLHYFTDDWEDAWQRPGTGWLNCETRSYVFEEDFMTEFDPEARLTETIESRRRRGKPHPMSGRDAQPALFEQAMENWEKQGLQRPDRLGVETGDAKIVY